MKSLQMILAVLFLGLTTVCAQKDKISTADRTRIETENQELSVDFPKDRLVNVQSTPDGKQITVLGFENGVSMKLFFRKSLNGKENLAGIHIDESKNPSLFDFKSDDYNGKSMISVKYGYENKIFIATKKFYYMIEVDAASKDKVEIANFLKSIKIKGQHLFTNTESGDFAGETVSADKLEKSPQVVEASDRKSEKIDRKITFEPLSAYVEPSRDFSVRPALVLGSPSADIGISPRNVTKGGEIKIAAQLKADGQIGDMIVYSDADKAVLKGFANSTAKVKFVPAQTKDGKPVDSKEVFWFYFGISKQMMIIGK